MTRLQSGAGPFEPAHDDWLDAMLRDARPAAIADGGFAARVMAALPAAVVAAAPAWRKPVVLALWTFALIGIALSMPGALLDVSRDAYRVFTAYPVSIPQLAVAVLLAAMAMWTATGMALRSQLAGER